MVFDFVKCFFYIYWDDHMVFNFFILLVWCIILLDFQMLNQPCIPGKKIPPWSWCVILFICFWIWFASIFGRFLHPHSQYISVKFHFLVMPLSGFHIRAMLASYNKLGSIPSSSIFWRSLWKIGNNSLNVLVEFTSETCRPRFFFVDNF